MHHRIRDRAVRVLWRAEREQCFVEQVLASEYGHGLDTAERAQLTDLVYGTVRWRATLDHVLARYRSPDGLRPRLRIILRLALYQMGISDRAQDRVAVSSAVDQARHAFGSGGAGLTNAILRRVQQDWQRQAASVDGVNPGRDVVSSPDTVWRGPPEAFPDPDGEPAANLALRFSLPRWLVERWIAAFGEAQARQLVSVQNQRPSLHCRVDSGVEDRAALRADLAAEGIQTEETRSGLRVTEGASRLVGSRAFRAGALAIQDETAASVVPYLGAGPGERVLELGAAPGGKTVPLARAVGPSGRVVAVDRIRSRMQRLRENLARTGLAGRVDAVILDGEALPEGFRGRFDRVLVDAPCSNTGVLARRHEARWRLVDAASATALVVRQQRLLAAGLSALRPGGALVYATCSILPEENQDVVKTALGETVFLVADEVTFPDGVRDGGYKALLEKRGRTVSN